jgi:hypothetical protein
LEISLEILELLHAGETEEMMTELQQNMDESVECLNAKDQ